MHLLHCHRRPRRLFLCILLACGHGLGPLSIGLLAAQVAALMKTPAAADGERAAKAALFSRFTQLLPGALAADADPAGSRDRVYPALSPAGWQLCEPAAQAGSTNGACSREHADALGPMSGGPGGAPGSGQGALKELVRPLVSELLAVMRDVVAHDPAAHQSLFRRAAGCTEHCRKALITVL